MLARRGGRRQRFCRGHIAAFGMLGRLKGCCLRASSTSPSIGIGAACRRGGLASFTYLEPDGSLPVQSPNSWMDSGFLA